ncbi:TIGR01548 family HAD-type hydrolase [Pantanalinema rosaneae CENA516]|uniref:TIGR01548 family HAD-type hydrolase n=1 Tax=Pantanalinema rosaneae TaxID=1620701 RepID=UPI003D6EBC42
MIKTAIVVFDIDGVVRDVSGSYRRALADTVEQFTQAAYRPSQEDIDDLKTEGRWNNDWEASQEMIYRYFESQGRSRSSVQSDPRTTFTYEELVAFFQSRYRGTDPVHWNGYICQEPLLMTATYLDSLTQAGIQWGFFSGATRGSAGYVLEKRLGLQAPVLVAMEDAPGKPDPTGLQQTVERLQVSLESRSPVIYVGDTVADMFTAKHAREQYPDRSWFGVGVIPPHAQTNAEHRDTYAATLRQAGAEMVLDNVQELTPGAIERLLGS